MMFYGNGETSHDELMLVPINCSSWCSLLNHHNKGNCASLRVVVDGRIRVLLYTKRVIRAGEELLYSYNGFYKGYPTEGFEDYSAPKH